MPSYLFDPEIFAEIILDIHGHTDNSDVYFIERDGHRTQLHRCRFDESFLGVSVGEDGTAYESRDPRAWCLEYEIPTDDIHGCYLEVSNKTYSIQGSEPNGV